MAAVAGMPCYHPITAYKSPDGGKVRFKEDGDAGAAIELPCGRCIGCRLKRTQEWAMRCMHEAQMHKQNAYITLTYEGENIHPSLNYQDFQKFIRRLRKSRQQQTLRYFAAGEYGGESGRPHWHALIFGTNFADQQPIAKNLNRSPELEELWPHGFSSIGEVTWQSAGYVAAYCVKKVNGPTADNHYTRVNLTTGELIRLTPEMARMSLKPAIGRTWLEKYWREVYEARTGVVTKPGGNQYKAPRYYDKMIEKWIPERAREIETIRIIEAKTREKDNTDERLKTKETVTKARLNQKQRKL